MEHKQEIASAIAIHWQKKICRLNIVKEKFLNKKSRLQIRNCRDIACQLKEVTQSRTRAMQPTRAAEKKKRFLVQLNRFDVVGVA